MAFPGQFRIPRRRIRRMEGMYVKMWDPPTASPRTPEFIDLDPARQPQHVLDGIPRVRPNPVPEFTETVVPGFVVSQPHTVQRDLMHGDTLVAWDGKVLNFFMFRDADLGLGGFWPGGTIRVPRQCIYHCQTHGHGPPPHTIHWHGTEPMPSSDGVGHCSMEIGDFLYQWQPNFIGTYFHHCHRNTVQHFEFGLYGMTLIETPDAYDPDYPLNNTLPIGPTNIKDPGGYPRRTQAKMDHLNLAAYLGSKGFTPATFKYVPGNLWDTDPLGPPTIYPTNPHAQTVEYDREVLWVFDDRDSQWSDRAKDARAFYPKANKRPGVDDTFYHGFFHDFRADYWFVTGVGSDPRPNNPNAVRGPGSIGRIGTDLLVPPGLNSGVTGMMVDITASVDETIFVRCLNGAYNDVTLTMPLGVDLIIVEWDGRALGCPPYGFNKPYVIPGGNPIHFSVARRFGALIRSSVPIGTATAPAFATVQFYDTRLETASTIVPGLNGLLHTTQIPIRIL
jgi:hypothetical protein